MTGVTIAMTNVFVALILFVSSRAYAGDFEDGLDAAMRYDYAEAARLFKRAADQGNAEAQIYLGLLYKEGKGVGRDVAESGSRFRKAAEQGSPEAQFNLGLMYYEGRNVPQDFAESVKWYRLAAKQGNGYAQANLGHMYAEGQGVTRDLVRAHGWLSLAANSNDEAVAEGAGLRANELASRMTPQHMTDAQKFASNCIATGYKDCE